MINKLFGIFSKDVGIDLGTANTLVYVRGRGIVINEPSVVAVNQKTGEILAVGQEAKRMVGRTPAHIVATRPLVSGVVSDFEVTEKMLKYFFDKVHREGSPYLPHRPRVVIGVPCGGTEVERRAVEEAARNAGAREAYLVEEPMAAAIGAQLPIQEPGGNFIIDIGGGTTEVAVISLGGIVISKSLRVAGDRLSDDIIRYSREEFRLAIGERTAEEAKIAIGSVKDTGEGRQTVVRGRDIATGLPKEIVVNESQIREAMFGSVRSLVDAIKTTIEKTPPELVADLMTKGIIMAGGGSLLRGLPELIADETGVPVRIADDPLSAVVRGTGLILEDIDGLREILLSSQYDPAPQ
jgi:rod shape-determining protein MreB